MITLTHNQLAFLQGLLDRPGGMARSRRDPVDAATPYVIQLRASGGTPRPGFSYSCLYKAARNLPLEWVERRRAGNRVEFRLRPRGRAILAGRVGPIHVRGIGPWAPRSSSRPRT
jgi:hypothetical protein